SPNVAVGCSLSDVLENHVPPRFFLSPRAAQGILRRAEKRGRMLPSRLQAALESLAQMQGGDAKTITTSQSNGVIKGAICGPADMPQHYKHEGTCPDKDKPSPSACAKTPMESGKDTTQPTSRKARSPQLCRDAAECLQMDTQTASSEFSLETQARMDMTQE